VESAKLQPDLLGPSLASKQQEDSQHPHHNTHMNTNDSGGDLVRSKLDMSSFMRIDSPTHQNHSPRKKVKEHLDELDKFISKKSLSPNKKQSFMFKNKKVKSSYNNIILPKLLVNNHNNSEIFQINSNRISDERNREDSNKNLSKK